MKDGASTSSARTGLELDGSILPTLLTAARTAHPREACGLLLGTGHRITALIEARNIHPTPETHFEIDPQALIDAHRAEREGGLEVLGYYHSHPNGPARPSATDARMAAGDGRIWAIVGAAEAGDTSAKSPDTLGGGEIDALRGQIDTSTPQIDTLPGFGVMFWRDDDAGFTPLSYKVANG